MEKRTVGLLALAMCIFLVPQSSYSGEPAPAAITLNDSPNNNQPPIVMVAPGVFEIGGCKIIKEQNRVELPARVNMREGLLEYLLVGSAGKLHESLLSTKVEPFDLQIALLLMGLEGSTAPLPFQGDLQTPKGDPVSVKISWLKNNEEYSIPIEHAILNKDKQVDAIPWVFTGSVVQNGIFMAQVEKSMVAVYHDPFALIDHQLAGGANDEIWFANPAVMPEVGTELTVIIEKRN